MKLILITTPTYFVEEDKILTTLFDEGLDDRQFVREEFLILRAVDFIMGPLFERDVSADKENKPADLAILFLNDSK